MAPPSNCISPVGEKAILHGCGLGGLGALRQAGLLDEVFLTETDVVVDESRHRNVLKIFEFEQEGADLIAEGRTGDDSPWRFRRWRFSRR